MNLTEVRIPEISLQHPGNNYVPPSKKDTPVDCPQCNSPLQKKTYYNNGCQHTQYICPNDTYATNFKKVKLR